VKQKNGKAAMLVPDSNYPLGEADTVIAELLDVEGGGLSSLEHLVGKGGQAAPVCQRVAPSTCSSRRRGPVLPTKTAERLSATGLFKTKLFVAADLAVIHAPC
jgi:hypothetical protein